MKGRQRTLLDTFWRDPQYSSLSTEDKFCLIYLSTCSYSNMIGVYTFVASIMAAEAGWDINHMGQNVVGQQHSIYVVK